MVSSVFINPAMAHNRQFNVSQQSNNSSTIRRSPDLDIAISSDLDIFTGTRHVPGPTDNYRDCQSILDPMTSSRAPVSARRASFKRHSPMDHSERPSSYSHTNRRSMYTHFEHEEPFIRQVTKGLIVMGGYRDFQSEYTTKVLRPTYEKELLMEHLASHIETINGLIATHSRNLRAKRSFGRRLVSILLFKPPPHNSARFEDASMPCTSSDPFDHLKLPGPLVSYHLPLSQQYYRHLFDMADHVTLHDDVKSMISRGFARAQVLEGSYEDD